MPDDFAWRHVRCVQCVSATRHAKRKQLILTEHPYGDPMLRTLDLPSDSAPIRVGHLHLGGVNPQGRSIQFSNLYVLRDGEPCIPCMGEFHFSRYPNQFWEEELLKIKAGGI